MGSHLELSICSGSEANYYVLQYSTIRSMLWTKSSNEKQKCIIKRPLVTMKQLRNCLHFLLLLLAQSSLAFVVVPRPLPFCCRREWTCLKKSNKNDDHDEKHQQDDESIIVASSPTASRRNVLQSAAVAAAGLSAPPFSSQNASAAATATASSTLLADLPMLRFHIPGSGSDHSVDYVGVQVCLNGSQDPVEFMLDTGLTLEMMTPHLRDQLGLKSQRSGLQGLSAGDTSATTDLVTWRGARLCSKDSSFPLPELHAVVTEFPQAHMDPKHDPVEGMLGMELLSQYDLDLDFTAGRVRLYQPGTAMTTIRNKNKMVEIPAIVINETGLLGIRLTIADKQQQRQPILAFLDCGSTFSAINWKAAAYLGLPTDRKDPTYQSGPKMLAVGVDGRPLQLPTVRTPPLTFAGDAVQDNNGRMVGFATPPAQWKPWKPVQLAVGDLPVFAELLGVGGKPYDGPAVLVGLDVLGQRRIIFESAGNAPTRRRRLFVEAQ